MSCKLSHSFHYLRTVQYHNSNFVVRKQQKVYSYCHYTKFHKIGLVVFEFCTSIKTILKYFLVKKWLLVLTYEANSKFLFSVFYMGMEIKVCVYVHTFVLIGFPPMFPSCRCFLSQFLIQYKRYISCR